MSARIEKVILKIGRREITMGVDEARELYASLEEMFGAKIINPAPVVIPAPYPVPTRPYWEWTSTTPIWGKAVSGTNLEDGKLAGTVMYNAEDRAMTINLSSLGAS